MSVGYCVCMYVCAHVCVWIWSKLILPFLEAISQNTVSLFAQHRPGCEYIAMTGITEFFSHPKERMQVSTKSRWEVAAIFFFYTFFSPCQKSWIVKWKHFHLRLLDFNWVSFENHWWKPSGHEMPSLHCAISQHSQRIYQIYSERDNIFPNQICIYYPLNHVAWSQDTLQEI